MSKQFTIVGLGEALWDIFPEGPRFGGAPANFACHAAMLGADAFMVSAVGADDLGEQAVASLRACGVHTEFVRQSRSFPTGTVQVELDETGKPRFEIREGVAWDHLEWSDDLAELAARADAVCFGTLGQRSEPSAATIRRFLKATGPNCLRIFDVNLRQQFYDRPMVLDSLGLATALKLNDEELPIVAAICGIAGGDREVMVELGKRFDLCLAALTRGALGAMLVRGETAVECGSPAVQVKDTVGAGDAFTATMALGWLQGHDLDVICRQACRVAAFVCSQSGATPRLPEQAVGDY